MASFVVGDWVEVSTLIPHGEYGHGINSGLILRVVHIHIDNKNTFLFLLNPPPGYEARTDPWPCILNGVAFTVNRWWPVLDGFCKKVNPKKIKPPNLATLVESSYKKKQTKLWRKILGLDDDQG